MAEVHVWEITGHPRSHAICTAMMTGIAKVGDRPRLRPASHYRVPDGDAGVFYGLAGFLAKALKAYPETGRPAVYVDLGYFGRHAGGRLHGYHKLAVNGRHPTAYFQKVRHPPDRADALGVTIAPWRPGRAIVVAGMGPKGARAEGHAPNNWETQTIRELRRHTARPIIYRPKPNYDGAKAIPGTILGDRFMDLDKALADAHAIVAHHSNACVEGLLMGVPAFSEEGVALALGSSDMTQIESPRYPEGRFQWLCDLAYTQWSVAEMATGRPWRHLKDEGLVP